MDYSRRYLDVLQTGIQATIIAQNEPKYQFYQYKKDGFLKITRPVNSELMYDPTQAERAFGDFLGVLGSAREIALGDHVSRAMIGNSIYTMQQSIGMALDALPAGKENTARKVNGDLFERLILLLIREIGIECNGGVISVPVEVDGAELFRMSYQHDLIVTQDSAVKVIGSVKTTSKDRVDKIFIDKFLYSKLTGTSVPHIAVFLHDVQRKGYKTARKYGVSATFLPGHFKGYTVKLNPLDGVYYCDLRPSMLTDEILRDQIRGIDHLFCTDIWRFLQNEGNDNAVILPDADLP